jgi:hypothetical protein
MRGAVLYHNDRFKKCTFTFSSWRLLVAATVNSSRWQTPPEQKEGTACDLIVEGFGNPYGSTVTKQGRSFNQR